MQGCSTHFETGLATLLLPAVFMPFFHELLSLKLISPGDSCYKPCDVCHLSIEGRWIHLPWFQHVKLPCSFLSSRGSSLPFHTLPCLLPSVSHVYKLEKKDADFFFLWSLVAWISSAVISLLITMTAKVLKMSWIRGGPSSLQDLNIRFTFAIMG